MKVKSKIDIITNSSSECFTLETTNLKEVASWLEANIGWAWTQHSDENSFADPEIMEKGEGIIQWLVEFGDLYDSHDLDSIEDYKIKHCLCVGNFHWETNSEYDYTIKKNGIKIIRAFERYCEENKDIVLKYFTRFKTIDEFWEYYDADNGDFYTTIWPLEAFMNDEVYNFLKEFVEWYEKKYPKYIPSWWSIPNHLDLQYWKGKVGFCTTDENSISYEDMNKIITKFGGEHWHMG